MNELSNQELFTFSETIVSDIFEGTTYPREALPKIGDFILTLGAPMSPEEYGQTSKNVWIAKSTKVAPTAFINVPAKSIYKNKNEAVAKQ
ncbi:MAG: hypothetical protein II838_10985 [Lachnospiraceae bacterium]|nr:hypothetical protein [Lachnospiraceae bacterium]